MNKRPLSRPVSGRCVTRKSMGVWSQKTKRSLALLNATPGINGMSKTFWFWILLIFFLCSLTLGEQNKGPETILFSSILGSVRFYHHKHRTLISNDCLKCHHLKDENKKQACRDCHKGKNETTTGDPPSFYHVKMNLCRGCHREKRNADRKAKAPVNCRECHNVKELK